MYAYVYIYIYIYIYIYKTQSIHMYDTYKKLTSQNGCS